MTSNTVLSPLTDLTPDTGHTLAEVRALLGDWPHALDRRVAAGELALTTRQTYTRGAAKFTAWAATQPPGEVTRDTLRDWIGALRAAGHSPGSITTWRAGRRTFYAWAIGAGRLGIDPPPGVRGDQRAGTKHTHTRQALTDREVALVLSQPDPRTATGARDLARLSIMAYTAARSIEVHRADLADLTSAGGRLVLYAQGKGRDDKDELIVIDQAQAVGAL